jgi:hypothetical protein
MLNEYKFARKLFDKNEKNYFGFKFLCVNFFRAQDIFIYSVTIDHIFMFLYT